ncbi:MAG TPA: GYF domain-containing protein [Thermoguttaceae bacterium]|nr:GYF domain-containing protein [Thermoguttaceae bacterium]
MAEQWYFEHQGNHFGPVSTGQLKELAACGKIQPSDSVWKDGTHKWVRASKIQGLFPSPRQDQVAESAKAQAGANAESIPQAVPAPPPLPEPVENGGPAPPSPRRASDASDDEYVLPRFGEKVYHRYVQSRYPALKLLAAIYQILGIICAIIAVVCLGLAILGVLSLIASFIGSDPLLAFLGGSSTLIFFGAALGSAWTALLMHCTAEVIRLGINVEANTRTTNRLLRELKSDGLDS